MARSRKTNPWNAAALAFFGLAFAYGLAGAGLQKWAGVRLPAAWFFLLAGLASGFGITAAVRDGHFRRCTRRDSPVFFWFQAALGYAFSATLLALVAHDLVR